MSLPSSSSNSKNEHQASSSNNERSVFKKQDFSEVKKELDKISDTNELKKPLMFMADQINKRFDKIEARMDKGFNELKDQLDQLNKKLDNIGLEKQVKKLLQKEHKKEVKDLL